MSTSCSGRHQWDCTRSPGDMVNTTILITIIFAVVVVPWQQMCLKEKKITPKPSRLLSPSSKDGRDPPAILTPWMVKQGGLTLRSPLGPQHRCTQQRQRLCWPHSSLAASPSQAGTGTAKSTGLKVRHGPNAPAKGPGPPVSLSGPRDRQPRRDDSLPWADSKRWGSRPGEPGQTWACLTLRVRSPTSSL